MHLKTLHIIKVADHILVFLVEDEAIQTFQTILRADSFKEVDLKISLREISLWKISKNSTLLIYNK